MPGSSSQGLRSLALVFCAILLLAACGKEALPRAARAARTAQPTQPARPTEPATESEPADTRLAARIAQPIEDRRSAGDPHAPITVVEYGDYQ